MFCTKCGEMNPDSAKFCTVCGNKLEQPTAVAEYQPTPVPGAQEYVWEAPISYSYKDFYEMFASKNTKGWVKAMYIICFITAGLSVATLALGSVLSLLDVAFYGAMGFLLMKNKKSIYALIPTVYSGVFSLIGLLSGGGLTGIFALICGIMSTIGLNKLQKAYAEHLQHRTTPANPI